MKSGGRRCFLLPVQFNDRGVLARQTPLRRRWNLQEDPIKRPKNYVTVQKLFTIPRNPRLRLTNRMRFKLNLILNALE